MNYKKKVRLIIFLILMVIPVKTLALTLNLECNSDKITAGGSATCTISGNSDEEITSINATFSSKDDMIELTSFIKNDAWSSGETNSISVQSDTGISGDFTVGTITVTAKESITAGEYSVTISSGDVSASDSFTVENSLSTDNTLLSLEVDSVNCLENNAITCDIEVERNIDTITITATPKDNAAKVSGVGTKTNLKYGLNTFVIKVTSEAGTTKEYTVNITRKDDRSTDNNLNSFKFNNYDLDFSSDKDKYFITLNNNVDKIAFCSSNYENDDILCINFDSISYSDKATIGFVYNNKNVEVPADINDVISFGNINVGNNTLLVTVTAENESKKNYTFSIDRKDKDGNKVVSDDIPDVDENIGTGDATIIVIIILLLTSLGVTVYFYRDKLFVRFKRK